MNGCHCVCVKWRELLVLLSKHYDMKMIFFGYFVVDVKVDYVCYQQVKNCSGVVTKK